MLGRARREDETGVASTLLKLGQIKQHYASLGRPRYEKLNLTEYYHKILCCQ